MELSDKDNTVDIVAVSNEKQNRSDAVPFSEALEKTGFGIFNYSLILLGGLVMTCTLYETASVGFILPIAECDLQLTNRDKGILSTVGFIGIIMSAHLWGFLADTRGRRAVILPSLLISSSVSILSSFSPQFWLLVVFKFINGFFISASYATFFVYIGEFHNDRTRTGAIMASSCIFSVGAMLLPLICWAVINQHWSLALPFLGIFYKPWRLLILVCGSPGLVAGLILLKFPESPKFLLSIGKNKKAIKAIEKMHAWNRRSGELLIKEIIPEKDTIVQDSNEPSIDSSSLLNAFLNTLWKQTVPLFQKDLLLNTVIICNIQFWMYVTIHGIFMWYPFITDTMVSSMSTNSTNPTRICDAVHANQVKLINEESHHCLEQLHNKTFVYSITMESCYVVGFVAIGCLARKIQKNYILCALLFIFGVCGVLTNFIYDATLALILFNMFFISGAGIQVLSGITIELYPTHLRGMAICISMMVGRLGGVAGANVAGFLLPSNCEMTFYIAGTGLIASAFLTFLLPTIKHPEKVATVNSNKNKSLEDGMK